MSRGNIFYLISVLTILGIRLGVFLFPAGKVRVSGVPIHHFWIGVFVIALALLVPKPQKLARLILFSFGFAGFADELTFMLRGDGTLANYWSPYSIYGVIVVMMTVLLLRNKIVGKIS